MDGYAEPPTKEETPKSGYVDMYNEGETADVYEKDDDGEESGYAVHDGAAPPRSSAKQGDGGKAKKAKKKEKKMKKSSKPAKKSKKATGGERDFAIDEALLKREREEQERLAKFDPYGTATSAASGAGGSSSSVYVQDESFLPFFSSAAPASAYAVPSAAAEQEDVNASAYGAADGQAPSSVYATDDEAEGAAMSQAYGSTADEEARMQSVYGFDCYEASNNAVEDIEETRESLLDSAYALTPAEERELEAEEAARKPTKVPEGAYAGVGDGYAEVEAKPKKVKPQQLRKPKSKKSEELAHAYAGETFTGEAEPVTPSSEGSSVGYSETPSANTSDAYSDVEPRRKDASSDSDSDSDSDDDSDSSDAESDLDSASSSASDSEESSSDSDSDSSGVEDNHAKPRDEVKVKQDGRQWNEEFQSLCEPLLGDDPEVVLQRTYSIYKLFLEFQETASEIGKAIINEIHLPKSQKAYPPINAGGQAGGEKFLFENIFFKFCFDLHGYYGGDEFAMKSAGLELNGLRAYYKFINEKEKRDLHVPLMILIDYKGYRLIATSVLPLAKDTLIYGSADGAQTVHTDNKKMNLLMKEAAEFLGIKGHVVGFHSPKKIYGPGDIEGHAGKDGRLYVLDTARVYPPTPPSSVMKALFVRADNQEDLTSYRYIDSVNLTIPQYEKEARQLLVNQAKDRNRSVAMAKQRAAENATASASGDGDDAEEDYSSLTEDQLAFRIQKCLLPMGGTMFYEGRGTVNMVANYLAHREIRGNAVIIPAGFQGKRLYNLFRGEFLAEYVATTGTPISSDAFTGFGKDKWTVHNKEAREAGNYLVQKQIPKTIGLLQEQFHPVDGSQLTHHMHQCGVNMRFLGHMWRAKDLTSGPLRTIVLVEMITRSVKSVLRGVMRTSVSEAEMGMEIVKHFNFLLGESPAGKVYWVSLVRTQLLSKFEFDITTAGDKAWDLIKSESFKLSLHSRLQAQLGIRFVSGFKPNFNEACPFSIIHFMGVVPIINELISESSLTDAMAKAIQHSLDREMALSDAATSSGTTTDSVSGSLETPRTPRGTNVAERQERTKLRMLKQIVHLLERNFGADNMRVGANRLRIASSLHKLGKHAKALRQVNQVFADYHEMPLEIFIFARCLRGDIYHSMGDNEKAANEYYNTLRIANRYYGEGVQESESIGHPLSLIILNKLGQLAYDLHLYEALDALNLQFGILLLKFCPYSTREMQLAIWGVDIPVLLAVFNSSQERFQSLQSRADVISLCGRMLFEHQLGMDTTDSYKYAPKPDEVLIKRAKLFLEKTRQFNELQYSENLISCLTVSTAEALRENVPLIECYRRTLDKWDPEGESLQLRLESFEVVKGKPIDVNWQHKHQDNRARKRDLHIRIYRHQDWGKLNGRSHSLEWELIRETYLHQTPLGGHTLAPEKGATTGCVSFESAVLESGPYLVTLEDDSQHGWSKFMASVFLQVLDPDMDKTRLVEYIAAPHNDQSNDQSKVRVWDRFNNEEVSFVAVVDPLHTLYDTSRYFAVTGKGEVYSWSLAERLIDLGQTLSSMRSGPDFIPDPRPISALVGRKIAKVVTDGSDMGGMHVLALTQDKRAVYSWGANRHGQLGRGTETDTESVGIIEALEGETIVDIACGTHNSKAVTSDGRVFVWGANTEELTQLGTGGSNHSYPVELAGIHQRIRSIASGVKTTVAISEEGMVWVWGVNYGVKRCGACFPVPALVESLLSHCFVAVAVGDGFSMLLTDKGELFNWGLGDRGVLGNGSNRRNYVTMGTYYLRDDCPPPVLEPVQGHLKGKKVIQISAQDKMCCALTDQGEVYYWGDGFYIPYLAKELTRQGRGDKRTRITRVFAAPHKRLFATIDETSPSAPALPADAVTNRGLALREKQLLAWKTTFTVSRQKFIRGVEISEGLRFKWSRPNFISHNKWSIVLYHESNRERDVGHWPMTAFETLDADTQMWHGEWQSESITFPKEGKYYFVMERYREPIFSSNHYFMSIVVSVRSLGAEDFIVDAPASAPIGKPFTIRWKISDEARGADFGLVLAKTDEQGRPKFKEDDPEVLDLVLAETINAETTRMQPEGVWAASGWYYEGQYALLVYRWGEKRMFSYQPFAIKDEFISADDVLSFEVSPTTITTGQQITLKWNIRPGTRPDSYQYFGIFPVSDTTDTRPQAIHQVTTDSGEATINGPYTVDTYTVRYIAMAAMGMRTVYRCPTVITVQTAPPVMPAFPMGMMNPYMMMNPMAMNPYMQQAMAMNPYMAAAAGAPTAVAAPTGEGQQATAAAAMPAMPAMQAMQAMQATAATQSSGSGDAATDPYLQAMQAMQAMNPQMMSMMMMNPMAMNPYAAGATATTPQPQQQPTVFMNPQTVVFGGQAPVVLGQQPAAQSTPPTQGDPSTTTPQVPPGSGQ